jgi:hypothetical protein
MSWTRPAATYLGGLLLALWCASPALAGDAVLWGCHGPAGQPLGVAGLAGGSLADGEATTFGSGCAAPASAPGGGGLRASFSRADPAGASAASWSVAVPIATQLRAVRLTRRTTGFSGAPESGNPQRYTAQTSTSVLESAALDDTSPTLLDGVLSADPAAGESVRVGVACALTPSARCAAPAAGTVGVDLTTVALDVRDDDAPRGAVGGLQSPASGVLQLGVHATDAGLGLARTSATLDGRPAATTDLGAASCADLSPADPAIDLALGAACPAVVGNAALLVDTLAVADGVHQLTVTATDAAGNVATLVDQPFTVLNHPPPFSSSAILAIGNNTPGQDGGGSAGGGGVAGTGGATTPATACATPRLSLFLAQRPLRVSHGIAVLRSGARYRFSGRLTCLVAGHRRSAPRRLVVEILNKVKGRTLLKSGTTIGAAGAISVILSYRSSRTIVFRYRDAGSAAATASVSIRVLVSSRRR